MRIKMTWRETGDTLLFDAINPELADWFVTTSQKLGNRYRRGDMVTDILLKSDDTTRLIQEEIDYIETVNQQLQTLKMPTFVMPDDWYDQKQLNRLHKDWAQTRSRWPKLTELFHKIDQRLFESYQEMNCHIHLIENSFHYRFRDPTHWRAPNPFKNEFYEWENSQLYINYPGHGREAFEKFKNMDTDDDFEIDNINWDNIDSFLGLNLVRPYKLDPPKEFVEWCQGKNLVPHRDTLPLGNLVDWEKNLAQTRHLVTKNVTIQDNYFYLEIEY